MREMRERELGKRDRDMEWEDRERELALEIEGERGSMKEMGRERAWERNGGRDGEERGI